MTRFNYYFHRDGNLNKALEDYKKITSSDFVIDVLNYQNWLTEEYVEKPKPILDKVEHMYLENFLKPFRNKVTGIKKSLAPVSTNRNRAYLVIMLNEEGNLYLPYFNAKVMYLGMENNKIYSYETLIEKNHL